MPKPFTKNIFDLASFTMMYHWSLAQYAEQNPNNCDTDTLKLIEKLPSSHWENSSNFSKLFRWTVEAVTARVGLDGKVLKESIFPEINAVYDEFFPQHYGTKTMGLDWTLNPDYALFFATYCPVTR